MEPEQFQLLLNFFKVLSNDSRLKLVGMLAEKPCSVEELATRLELKEPTVSHHLAKLKALDLVSMQQDKNTHFYTLRSEVLQDLSKRLLALETIAAPDTETELVRWEEKVLRTFLEDEKLSKIPAARKKREVILRWLVEKFEFDKKYQEKEVNAIIQPIHWDSATLRRELIATGLMQRENNIYWRI